MVKTTLNPMETYRREQKKKEVKKHRAERQKEKKEKLQSMDRVALEEQLKLLERQMAVKTSTDGPSRKRKQELEDTLRAVVKRQKEMEEEEERRKKLTDASLPSPMSLTELMQRNREKFENPEDSIYYHPTLNPFGAPPPGKPQLYRQGQQPSGPMGLPRSPCHGQPSQHRHLERPSQHRFQHRLLLPRIERRIQEPPFATMQQPRGMVKRPGKRPPLPLDPPPPGTIQVPCRPPLPSGVIPVRPPPPPPAHVQPTATMSLPASSLIQQTHQEVLSPSNPMVTVAAVDGNRQGVAVTDEDNNVVAPYSTTEAHTIDDCRVEDDQVMDEDAAGRRAQLCSLVPVALRVHRQVPVTPSRAAIAGSVPSVITRRSSVPAPRTSVLRPARSVDVAPSVSRCATTTTTTSASSSMSKEYDAFIEDMKELL
uniref:Wbp11/ELF5/Saf1 N-terminal domain-containing protein n=1 Tax=Peronospora matthiolae TaxID=2874970 RepID=A0AAV1U3G6_9STRA